MSKLLKQRRGGKTSSRSKEFFDQLRALPTAEEVLAKVNELSEDELLPFVLEGIEEGRVEHQRRLLPDIANLRDDGCKWFWSRWGPIYFSFLGDAELLVLRDEVRLIWDPQKSDVEKQAIIDSWLSHQPAWFPARHHNPSPLWVVWRYRKILPNPVNIRATLALALVEHASRLKYCSNPDCQAPYLLAKRKNQKYCELGACTESAQRQYALAWWNKKGKKRRAAKKQKGQATKNKSRSR